MSIAKKSIITANDIISNFPMSNYAYVQKFESYSKPVLRNGGNWFGVYSVRNVTTGEFYQFTNFTEAGGSIIGGAIPEGYIGIILAFRQ